LVGWLIGIQEYKDSATYMFDGITDEAF